PDLLHDRVAPPERVAGRELEAGDGQDLGGPGDRGGRADRLGERRRELPAARAQAAIVGPFRPAQDAVDGDGRRDRSIGIMERAETCADYDTAGEPSTKAASHVGSTSFVRWLEQMIGPLFRAWGRGV